MARGVAHIQVEGYKEFYRAIRKAEDQTLPKRIGEAHRKVGQFIIAHLEPPPDPRAVGEGFTQGAPVRASATKRDVVLRAGGAHRTKYPQSVPDSYASSRAWAYVQWGKRQVGDIGSVRPKRPHIIGTALKYETEIRQELLDQVTAALKPAFNKAE